MKEKSFKQKMHEQRQAIESKEAKRNKMKLREDK